MHSGFSCFLMGADTLLMECGDILVREGHRVRGVISSAPRIGQWAADNGIPVVDPEDDYVEVLAAEPFDYLFAISHLAIIPDDVLALPQKLTVNFHDGPLPRYAGLNTPVWALMNRETGYGITWHVVTSGVDQGDILQQAMFEVSPGETALSLNTRCMATAVETFPELVRALAEGRESRTEQVLADRSYFGKFKRPPAASAEIRKCDSLCTRETLRTSCLQNARYCFQPIQSAPQLVDRSEVNAAVRPSPYSPSPSGSPGRRQGACDRS